MAKKIWLMGLLMLALIMVGCQQGKTPPVQTGIQPEPGAVLTQVSGYGDVAISKPHTYKNMSLFVLYRTVKETAIPEDFITLEEGLAQQKVVVSEKEQAEVRTLQVENLSNKPLFLQVGDVLKGGKQDRTIQVSITIPSGSGKVDVPSLCVEQSRWTGQVQFSAASNSANSNALKIAIQKGEQGEVWKEVAEFKNKAEKITGEQSKTSSLNEAIDNEKMKQTCAEYETAFTKLLDQYPNAIGVAYALNGKIQAVELFQMNGLLRRAYPKLLKAYANEAVVNQSVGEIKVLNNDEVKGFLVEMEKGETKQQNIKDNQITLLENDRGLSKEVMDEQKRVMHRQYLQK